MFSACAAGAEVRVVSLDRRHKGLRSTSDAVLGYERPTTIICWGVFWGRIRSYDCEGFPSGDWD